MIFSFFFIGCVYLSTIEANFVEELHPCPENDKICLKDLVQHIVEHIVNNGVEEFNISPIENKVYKNIEISSFNLINVTLVEGRVSGLKSCVITDVEQQIGKGYSSVSLHCDIALKGKHKIVEASPILRNLFGNNAKIHGNGNFKLNLKNVQMTFTFFYDMVKRNGEIYFKSHEDETRYKYNVEGVEVAADNIFLGDNDASPLMVEIMNKNWPFFIRTFGNDYFLTGVHIMEEILELFFDNTPAKYIVSTDLTPYVKMNE